MNISLLSRVVFGEIIIHKPRCNQIHAYSRRSTSRAGHSNEASSSLHFSTSRGRQRPPPLPQKTSTQPHSKDPDRTDMEVWMGRLYKLPPSARSVALAQLLRIEEEGAYAGLVGGSPRGIETDVTDPGSVDLSTTEGGRRALDERSRRQATNLVASVTRWRRRLAWVLSNLSPKKTNLSGMDPPLQLLLLMATYEILFLGLAPHAVNEYVNLAKRTMHEGCGKVANAVLRTVLRCVDSNNVPEPPMPVDALNASIDEIANSLGIATSHPSWLVKKWLVQFGNRATLALLRHNNQRPRYSVRIIDRNNEILSEMLSSRLGDDGIDWSPLQPSEYLPGDFVVLAPGALQYLLSAGIISHGHAQVQDEAAGLVVAVLDPQPGESVLDCCAAPGGKTLYAAARMKCQGRIVALDSSTSRLKALMSTAKNQNIDSFISSVPQDARQFCGNSAAADDFFDRVLVDAPCSGTGVLAKRADLRWKRRPEDLDELSSLQRELLEAAGQVVKAGGGVLVYSTCSLEREENQDIVEYFLNNTEIGKEFRLDEAGMKSLSIRPECLNKEGMLSMLPHVHGTDGAFAARLIRK